MNSTDTGNISQWQLLLYAPSGRATMTSFNKVDILRTTSSKESNVVQYGLTVTLCLQSALTSSFRLPLCGIHKCCYCGYYSEEYLYAAFQQKKSRKTSLSKIQKELSKKSHLKRYSTWLKMGQILQNKRITNIKDPSLSRLEGLLLIRFFSCCQHWS